MIVEKGIIGNAKVVRYLDRVLRKGFISHAYLFEGPEHVGKTTVALAFAGELLGDDAENPAPNPDLIRLAPDEEERQIGVEAARNLQKDLSLYPFKSPYKVAIIEKAEALSLSAANSLLKTMEEPGETSVIILVASDAGKILPTIRSRCQIISFNPVSSEEIGGIVRQKGFPARAQELVEIAQGRPGLAIRLLEDKELYDKMREDRKTVLEIFGKGNFARMDSIRNLYGMEKEEAAEALDGWIIALRAAMLESMADASSQGRERFSRMKTALEMTQTAREDILERNVNLRLAMENLVLSFK